MSKCPCVWQVREQEGIDAADGIDTLLVYLLAELDDDTRLAHFAEGQQQVTLQVVAGLLQRKGQSDTLAQLYACPLEGQYSVFLMLTAASAHKQNGSEDPLQSDCSK